MNNPDYSSTTIDSLPDEVMLMIFSWISGHDLCATVSLVSKNWLGIVDRSNRIRLKIPRNQLLSLPPLVRTYKNLCVNYLPSDTSASSVPQLKTLLEDCHNIIINTNERQEVLDDFLRCCKNLRSLTLTYPDFCLDIKTIDLSDLAQLSLLRELCLSARHKVVLFDTLGVMPEMRKLWMNDLEISDATMQKLIKSLPHLELLELTDDVRGLTPAPFVAHSGLGSLNRLYSLALPADVITDEVIGKMNLPRLRDLVFYKHKYLEASPDAIRETLAKNCPLLNVIEGTHHSVRFVRVGKKFVNVHECDETYSESSNDPFDEFYGRRVRMDLDNEHRHPNYDHSHYSESDVSDDSSDFEDYY